MANRRKILEVVISREVEASIDVVQWNYFDAEHLIPVHNGYQSVEILFEDGHNSLSTATVSLPLIPFARFSTVMFVSMTDRNTQVTYVKQLGVWSRAEICSEEIGPSSTKITMKYKFLLEGWKRCLAPALRKLIPKWNAQVWDEDLELKIRRQMILDWGFRDFVGLKASSRTDTDRVENEVPALVLPIRRPPDAPVNSNPLRISTSRRSVVRDL
jgi:hypothetical protein